MGRRCWVYGCLVNVACTDITLHGIEASADATIVQQWKDFCRLPVATVFPAKFHICGLHFHPASYTSPGRLRPYSVPVISIDEALKSDHGVTDVETVLLPQKLDFDTASDIDASCAVVCEVAGLDHSEPPCLSTPKRIRDPGSAPNSNEKPRKRDSGFHDEQEADSFAYSEFLTEQSRPCGCTGEYKSF